MSKTLTSSDSEYWNSYYRESKAPTLPSQFAVHVADTLEAKKVILDLGCGNGRDSSYFCREGHTVLSLDTSHEALLEVTKNSNSKAFPILADAATVTPTKPFADVVYSRFSLHSMDKDSYLSCIKNVETMLVEGGSFWIEVRSTEDELYEQGDFVEECVYKTDHSRRFSTLKGIVNDLENLSFDILFAKEQRGWAMYEDQDPKVIRIHCRRK
tara:strand:- start:570 stop:1205 length:636 start_codon:yes stop_codon:yes gene_type:complete